MTRTLVEAARAVLAVWDDVTSEGEDVAAAIERLRQAALAEEQALDPLNADLIETVEVSPDERYLLCVWVRQYPSNKVLASIQAGMVALADQIEQGGRRIVPIMLAPEVERIALVGFDVAAETADAAAEAEPAAVRAESTAAG